MRESAPRRRPVPCACKRRDDGLVFRDGSWQLLGLRGVATTNCCASLHPSQDIVAPHFLVTARIRATSRAIDFAGFYGFQKHFVERTKNISKHNTVHHLWLVGICIPPLLARPGKAAADAPPSPPANIMHHWCIAARNLHRPCRPSRSSLVAARNLQAGQACAAHARSLHRPCRPRPARPDARHLAHHYFGPMPDI